MGKIVVTLTAKGMELWWDYPFGCFLCVQWTEGAVLAMRSLAASGRWLWIRTLCSAGFLSCYLMSLTSYLLRVIQGIMALLTLNTDKWRQCHPNLPVLQKEDSSWSVGAGRASLWSLYWSVCFDLLFTKKPINIFVLETKSLIGLIGLMASFDIWNLDETLNY